MKAMVDEGPKQLKLIDVPDLPMKKAEVRTETMFSGTSHGTKMNVYR